LALSTPCSVLRIALMRVRIALTSSTQAARRAGVSSTVATMPPAWMDGLE